VLITPAPLNAPLTGMLMLPFARQLGEYTINRRW
jgi:hypothetical protein